MDLYFTDSSSVVNEIQVPRKYLPDFPKYTFDRSPQKLYGRDGTFIRGDGTVGNRQFKMKWSETGTSDTETRTRIRNVFRFFLVGQAPYYIEDRDNNLRFEVSIKEFDPKSSEGVEFRVHKGTITLIAANPYPEDLTEQSVSLNPASSNDTLNIPMAGDVEVFPRIELVAIDSIQSFTLEITPAELDLTITDTSFITGEKYVLDSRGSGEISLGGQDRSFAIVNGGMLRLKPGNNVLTYISLDGQVSLEVFYRNRYVI